MVDTVENDLASHSLISSRMVEGTPVFNREGEKVGKVHSMMIDKVTGQVAYAVLALGGFLHRIEHHVHPIPWAMLTYDPARNGYIVDVTRRVLEDAPVLTLDYADRPQTPRERDLLYGYYGAPF